MIEINEKNHQSVIISSLEKIYNQGRISGRLNSINLYLLNIIYKLLDNCCIELTSVERKILMDMYRNILFHSIEICNNVSVEIYDFNYKTPFFQAESTDCNNYKKADKIYFWQEENLNTTYSDILPLLDDQDYFLNKNFDTKEVFEIGKDIVYSNIGVICFAVTEVTDTENYIIYDILNNDVTSTFTTSYLDNIKTRIFVSKNIYSYGTMNFKIKKI